MSVLESSGGKTRGNEMARPNLFQALLDLHPHDGITPRENFLSEAFAHILRTDEAVRGVWISKLMGAQTRVASCEIQTRQSERHPEDSSKRFVDLTIEGSLVDGKPLKIYCEHKFHSPCSQEQLCDYQKIAKAHSPDALLCFVCATQQQKRDAAKCGFVDEARCILWEDAFALFEQIEEKSDLLKEFLDFMKIQGLSPGDPVTAEDLRALAIYPMVIARLLRLAERLKDEFQWDVVPRRFHAEKYVSDQCGRIGVWFGTNAWKPGLVLGFLYDASDHKVELLNPDKGIDLYLRIEAYPKDTKNAQPALDLLKDKRPKLLKSAKSVLLKGERGNGNNYTVLIVRDCLADLIEGAHTDADQLEVIHKRLCVWLDVLFTDGNLEKAFKKSGLDSGM